MDHHQVKVKTVIDFSHFEIGETITGSVYISEPETFNAELDLHVVKRSVMKEDEVLDTLSLNPIGDNISKEIRKIPFMIVPDDRWEIEDDERLFIQTINRGIQKVIQEVEIMYG